MKMHCKLERISIIIASSKNTDILHLEWDPTLGNPESAIRQQVRNFLLTHDPVPVITAVELEDVVLMAVVREVVRLDLDGELLHKRARVACLGVGIGVPCFLLGDQSRLGQQTFEPAWQVTAHMVDLQRVLTITARTVAVRSVFDYLHTATGACALISRLFLRELYSPCDHITFIDQQARKCAPFAREKLLISFVKKEKRTKENRRYSEIDSAENGRTKIERGSSETTKTDEINRDYSRFRGNAEIRWFSIFQLQILDRFFLEKLRIFCTTSVHQFRKFFEKE